MTNTQPSNPSSTSDPRLTVINLTDVPRGGWKYVVLDTNTTIQSGSIQSLKRDVRRHMIANNLELPQDLDESIEDSACMNLERKPITDSHSERPRWRAAEVLRFLKTIFNWVRMDGAKFVPMEEAERRAKICASCPMNVTVSGCLGCSGVATLVKQIRGDRRTKYDGQLHACNVCGCELKVKVLVPSEVIDNRGLEYPSHCWQNPTTTEPDANL
jgi:hypothetical protein